MVIRSLEQMSMRQGGEKETLVRSLICMRKAGRAASAVSQSNPLTP